jgi:uncharacterized protein YjbJ (UPF0337 family)
MDMFWYVRTPTRLEEIGMNEFQMNGRANQFKGKMREAAGKVSGNLQLEAEGKAQQLRGGAELAAGNFKNSLKHTISTISTFSEDAGL